MAYFVKVSFVFKGLWFVYPKFGNQLMIAFILQFMPGSARSSFTVVPTSFGTNDDECPFRSEYDFSAKLLHLTVSGYILVKGTGTLQSTS